MPCQVDEEQTFEESRNCGRSESEKGCLKKQQVAGVHHYTDMCVWKVGDTYTGCSALHDYDETNASVFWKNVFSKNSIGTAFLQEYLVLGSAILI